MDGWREVAEGKSFHDSAVAAVLIHEAIGDRLTCVFVDHGLLRQGEAERPTPPEPWCAVRLQEGLAIEPEAAEWQAQGASSSIRTWASKSIISPRSRSTASPSSAFALRTSISSKRSALTLTT